jgi:hypothetical protein
MAHFAQLDENSIVLQVIAVNNSELLVDGVESESKGVEFLTSLFGHPRWKQTSYNATIRKNCAGIGYLYDPDRDAFIPPTPYPSWLLDEQTCRWKPPTDYPNDGKIYQWGESTTSWKEIL